MNKQSLFHFKGLTMLVFLLGIAVLPLSAALRGEYWLDSDPGHGKATAFTPQENTQLTISTSSIQDGLHLLGVRVKNNKVWSQTYLYMFFRHTASMSEIIAGEYWLDSDPGHGNATAFTPSAKTDLAIPTNSLEDGWHVLGLRARNNTNWSQTYIYMLYKDSYGPNELSAAEYWIDTDPGIGKATSIAVSPSSSTVEFTLDQLDTLPKGYHTLGLRAKRGHDWSFTYKRQFMNVNAGLKMNVEKVVAWWDSDTENLINVPFVIENGEAVINNYILDASALTYGAHQLHLRATADTRESATYTYDVCKNAIPQFSVLQDTLCLGDELIILDESQDVQPETSYAWDMDGDGKTDYTDKGDLLYTYSKAGKYTITLTIQTGEGCESVYTKDVVVLTKSAPTVKLTRDKNAICEGESVIFTATPTNGGDQPLYTWYKNNVEIAGEKEAQLTLSDLKDKDTIQVQLTTSNKCASSTTALSSKLTQTVYALPVIEFLFAETYYTDENAFSLTNLATPTGGTFYINDAEAKLFNPKTNETGTYTVRYEVTNNNGCKSEAETTFELKERPIDPTANENITNELIPTKVLINDVIFILRGDKTYTLTGQEVK